MRTFVKIQFHWWIYTQNIPQLATFLQSPSYKIRRLTALKMRKMKNVEAIPFLKQILDDPVLKVAETAMYAIEGIAKTHHYSIDLQKYKQKLQERKKAHVSHYRRMDNFKLEKGTWIPTIKEWLKKPIAYGSGIPN